MNCHDAREGFSHGGMGLTDRALVHAHVMHCVACQQGRESLPQVVSARPEVAPVRAATRLRELLVISLTVSGQAGARMTGSARVGVTGVVDLLGRVRGRLSVFAKRSERAAANVILHVAHLRTWLCWSLMIAFRRAARVVMLSARVGVTGIVDLLGRVRGLLSGFVKRSERAAASVITHFGHLRIWIGWSLMIAFRRAARVAMESVRVGVTGVVDLLGRVPGLLSGFVKRSERGAAGVITRFAHLRMWLRWSLMIAFQGAARVAMESARVGVTEVVDLLGRVRGLLTRVAPLLTRLRVLLSISFMVSVRAGRRVIAARLVEAMGILALLTRVRRLLPLLFRRSERAAVRAIGATSSVGRIVVTTAGGALSLLGARMSAFGARPLLKVCSGIVSLAILLGAILSLGPRQWPDNLMLRLSTGERLSRDVRRPVDRSPAGLAAEAPLVRISAPEPVSAPPSAPVEVSSPSPEIPRAAMRRKPAETQTEIPPPMRGSDSAFARGRATASAPLPTEAAQNAEASDSTAVIDWLLKGGSSRRRIENP
jgi:hypothetical protein